MPNGRLFSYQTHWLKGGPTACHNIHDFGILPSSTTMKRKLRFCASQEASSGTFWCFVFVNAPKKTPLRNTQSAWSSSLVARKMHHEEVKAMAAVGALGDSRFCSRSDFMLRSPCTKPFSDPSSKRKPPVATYLLDLTSINIPQEEYEMDKKIRVVYFGVKLHRQFFVLCLDLRKSAEGPADGSRGEAWLGSGLQREGVLRWGADGVRKVRLCGTTSTWKAPKPKKWKNRKHVFIPYQQIRRTEKKGFSSSLVFDPEIP